MRLTYKYQLFPTSTQSAFLADELKEAASLYNAALEERIGAYRLCRKSISYCDQADQLKAMRADGCLTLANFSCCQNVLRRLDRAFAAFFARCKRGEKKVGFPRFRSFRRYDSLTFPSYGDGCKLINSHLRIQGAGNIKIKLHRPVEGKIKTVTVKRKAGLWFASFSVECDPKLLPPCGRATGIDVGLTSFATLADGTKFVNPRHYRNAEARLRRCQRKVARRKKGSARRQKAVLLFERANAHVKNQRSDFHHKLSRRLVNDHGAIAIEDLNVKGLANGILAKSVRDVGWAFFFGFLLYKAESAGRKIVKVDPRGTSQTCTCGASVPKTLADRWHECEVCGLSADRDFVSAQVILQRSGIGLQALTWGSSPSIA